MFAAGSTIRKRRLWDSEAAVKAYALARRAAERVGLQLVLKTYYSPIPDLGALPESVWAERDPLRGIDLDLDAQVERLRGRLAEHIAAFTAARASGDYDLDNASYPPADARLLYAVVRDLAPANVVELGSGQTTRVIARACVANAADGVQSSFRAFDPFPIGLDESLPGLSRLERTPAQEVPEEVFSALGDGDILFVDTTHTVKLGGDVNHIVLDVLPILAPGVLIHFHDIFLPWEYPREWSTEMGYFWAEQYLLQAFLAFNREFEVVLPAQALARDYPDRLAGVVPSLREGGHPGSMWLRRTLA
jgi:hypothetical protein